MTGDLVPANNALSGTVTVQVLNVGALRILAPAGTVDSGTVSVPQARVRNYGTSAAGFNVTFRVGSFYSNTQAVAGLAPGDSATVTFAAWNVIQPGSHATRCTTALAGDLVTSNDALSGTVTVRVPGDAGVSRIIAPAGTIDSNQVVTPQAMVHNYGAAAITFPVTFRIAGLYANTQTVTSLAAGDSAVVSFAVWTAARRGSYATGCTTAFVGDTLAANDGAAGTVTVQVRDIGLTAINRPAGTYEPYRVVVPAATVRNNGSVAADFTAYFYITDPNGLPFYAGSRTVTGLAPGASVTVDSFPACTLDLLGDWTTRCSTLMPGDANPANNVLAGGFNTQSMWVEVRSIPTMPSGKPVKDGAWLTYNSSSDRVYAAKGNKSQDFYAYDPGAGGWLDRKPIPYGIEAKPPRKGTCAATDGANYIYMAKGNNTLGWWRYDIARDSWQQIRDVTIGLGGKVKNGAGAVYVPVAGGQLYLLKGNGPDFVRYNVATQDWEQRAQPPNGASPKWNYGSFLLYDGYNTVYAHKAKYNELWSYNTLTDSWNKLTGMPFVNRSGRSKKSKDGGSGTWFADGIFALKGGNTLQFWRYDPTVNDWLEYDEMPGLGSTGVLRRVNGGQLRAMA